jgi:hypothetical protein
VAIIWGNNLCQFANIGVKIFSNIKYIIFPLLRQKIFSNIKYIVFPLLRQKFFTKMCRLFLITLKYFYQYLTDKIYNNKYFFHQNPGPLSPTIAKLWQNYQYFLNIAIRWQLFGEFSK